MGYDDVPYYRTPHPIPLTRLPHLPIGSEGWDSSSTSQGLPRALMLPYDHFTIHGPNSEVPGKMSAGQGERLNWLGCNYLHTVSYSEFEYEAKIERDKDEITYRFTGSNATIFARSLLSTQSPRADNESV